MASRWRARWGGGPGGLWPRPTGWAASCPGGAPLRSKRRSWPRRRLPPPGCGTPPPSGMRAMRLRVGVGVAQPERRRAGGLRPGRRHPCGPGWPAGCQDGGWAAGCQDGGWAAATARRSCRARTAGRARAGCRCRRLRRRRPGQRLQRRPGGGGLGGKKQVSKRRPPACGSTGMDWQAAPTAEFGQDPRVPGQFVILRRRVERREKRGCRLQPGRRFVRGQVPCEQRL